MADDPENPPKKTWSSSEYRRRKAERDANRPASEQGQSPLRNAAEQMARDSRLVGKAFQQATEGLVEAKVDAIRAQEARRKSDMEEAFSNALAKSKASRLAPTPASNSAPDEIQKILDEPALWDASQSGIMLEQSYSTRRWIQAKNSIGRKEIIGMIAAAFAPLIAGVVVGSTINIQNGIIVAAVTIALEIAVLACLYFWVVPKEMDKALSGDLAAAKNQLLEERRKLHRLANLATGEIKHWRTQAYKIAVERDEQINRYDKLTGVWETSKRELSAQKSETNLLQSQLDKKSKQDLSIKQERVVLEKIQAPSGTLRLVDWHVTVFLRITNRHEFDNAITEYGLTIVLPGSQDLKGVAESIVRLVSKSTGEELVDLNLSRDVPLKRGHPRRGAVRFRVSGNDLDLNLAGADYVLRIQDGYDVAHRRKGKLPEPNDDLCRKIPDRAFGG